MSKSICMKVAAQETQLEVLKSKLAELETQDQDCEKRLKSYQKPEALLAKNRYELVAPPNALYSDKVICAFLFCPVCACISGGEFSSIEEAKEHVKYDPLHKKILKEGGKKFTDKLKCARCRICGIDIFGGNDILSHLLSDTHRFNFVALHDANNPSLLDSPLETITTEELEEKLVEQIKVIYEEMQAQKKIQKEEELLADRLAAEKKTGKKGKKKFTETSFESPPKKVKTVAEQADEVIDLDAAEKKPQAVVAKPSVPKVIARPGQKSGIG